MLKSPAQFRTEAPPSLTSPAYLADLNEVALYGGSTSALRTAEMSVIARENLFDFDKFAYGSAEATLLFLSILIVVIVFFTQYLSWSGVWSLYEQHAFLLPVPFVGM